LILLDKLSSIEFLDKEAWATLNKDNPESYGLSQESLFQFKSQIASRLISISHQLKSNAYKFSNTRASVIPKDNGKFRPLQIPDIQDRVVLKGLAIIIEGYVKEVLSNSLGYSFAYQKGLGVHNAIKKMKEYYDNGYTYILEADIINFFPTVNRNIILSEIFKHLPDISLNQLITEGISQAVGGLDLIHESHHYLFQNTENGIPQGNPLSPLFSNIFLAPFDLKMIQNSFALIRYADDFIVMCKTIDEAKRAYELAKDVLENQLSLKLHELSDDSNSKTKIVDPLKQPFAFLSVAFDGKRLYPSRKTVDRFLKGIEKNCNSTTECKDVFTLLMKLKFSIEGWVSSYFYTECEIYFEEIDSLVNQQLLNGLRRYDWKFLSNSITKVPYKYRKRNNKGRLDSGECLSSKQRKFSGVPFCNDILTLRRKENPALQLKNPIKAVR